MEQYDRGAAILEAADLADPGWRWIAGSSVEAVEGRQQLEAIVGLFYDLDAALDDLGYRDDQAACQLSRHVRAEMIQRWHLGLTDHVAP